MVQTRKKEIICEDLIFNDEDILEMKITERFISDSFDDTCSANQMFAKFKLIKNRQRCRSCEGMPQLSYVKSKSSLDGYRWQCTRPCTYTCTIRYGSYFQDSRYSFNEIFLFLHKYIKGDTFSDISYELSKEPKSVSNLADLAREVICNFIHDNGQMIGGREADGGRKIVEIDESQFFKRKYNQGRLVNGQWYVGGIERGTRNCFIVPVPNRNAQTMVSVISSYVNDGSLIITDKWRAYTRALSEMPQMKHSSVNYSLNFVDPDNPMIHTQNIEGLWSRSKYFIRKKKGISVEKQSQYLIQFLWEYKFSKRQRINKLIILLQFFND